MIAPSHNAPVIVQLTSRHSLEDERILHRMARTAARHGYRSVVVGPSAGDGAQQGVSLVACPVVEGTNGHSRPRWTSLHLLRWALRSGHTVFQFHDPDLLLVGLILKCAGRRVIYDAHEDFEANMVDRVQALGKMGCVISKAWWWFERSVAWTLDAVVTADSHVAGKFRSPEGLALGNYPPLSFAWPAGPSTRQTFNIIYVGAVTAERGIDAALDAMLLLPQKDIRLHILGACRDERLARRMKADARVVYHGFVPWTELARHYQSAHLGLALYQPIASFTYFPGDNAVKSVEYMAAGLPVLCSDFPGLRAFVETPGFGLTVKPDDPSAIAGKICALYDDTDLRARLGRNGRQAFEKTYHWESVEPQLVALYQLLAGWPDKKASTP